MTHARGWGRLLVRRGGGIVLIGCLAVGGAWTGVGDAARHLITGQEIAPRTIKGRNIADSTIGAAKLTRAARDSLRGRQGPTGLTGPPGLTGSQGPVGPQGGSLVATFRSRENVGVSVPDTYGTLLSLPQLPRGSYLVTATVGITSNAPGPSTPGARLVSCIIGDGVSDGHRLPGHFHTYVATETHDFSLVYAASYDLPPTFSLQCGAFPGANATATGVEIAALKLDTLDSDTAPSTP